MSPAWHSGHVWRLRVTTFWERHEIAIRLIGLAAMALLAIFYWRHGPRWIAYSLAGLLVLGVLTLPLDVWARRRRRSASR